MANQTTTRQINIRVRGDGAKELKKISSGFGRIERNTRNTSKALAGFGKIFGAAIAGIGIREIVNISDSVELLFNRIKAFEGEEGAQQAFRDLADAANFTRTSIDSLAESYARVRLATQELGLSQEATIGFTTALQQSFRIAGSSIAEATGATIQLTQGLASGALRGQELRSVLEANAVIGEILAREFNITRGQLIKFGETGRITSDRVIKALAENFNQLNKRAESLGQTIGQTVNIQLNKFKTNLLAVNQSFGVSDKIAKLAENLDVLATAIIAVGTAIATAKIASFLSATLPAAIETTLLALAALRFNFLATVKALFVGSAVINPIIPLISALAGGVAFLALNWEKASPIIAIATGVIYKEIRDFAEGSLELLGDLAEKVGASSYAESFRQQASQIGEGTKEVENGIKAARDEFIKLQQESEGRNFTEFGRALKESASNLKNLSDESGVASVKIAELNRLQKEGIITTSDYSSRLADLELDEISEKFDKGKATLEQYNRALDKADLADFNQKLSSGSATLSEYNENLRKVEFKRVERGFQRGTESILEYNKAALESSNTFQPGGALFVGISEYIQSAGTLSSNIADAINNTFGRLEDSLVEFVQTGKFQFREFTKAILDDLTRIIIRQTIVNQLAQGITGAIGVPTAPTATPNAKGNAFNQGGKITAFADGGVVSSPTLFGFGRNQTGLMGEAGPEAILPLKRSSSGDLGVKATPSNVTVNIINNSNASEVEQRESEDQFGNKTLDIIINQKVNDGIAGGQFDRTFREVYGLRRRGR